MVICTMMTGRRAAMMDSALSTQMILTRIIITTRGNRNVEKNLGKIQSTKIVHRNCRAVTESVFSSCFSPGCVIANLLPHHTKLSIRQFSMHRMIIKIATPCHDAAVV